MTAHLITEAAKLRICTRCGEYTIVAISGGINTAADIQPLSVDEEIAALLTGRRTFDFAQIGLRYYLHYRDLFAIRANRIHPVVAAHRHRPSLPSPSDIELTTLAKEVLPDEPPF